MIKSSFLIAGKHAVTEALKNPNRKVLRVFLTEESKKKLNSENQNKHLLKNVKIFYENDIEKIADTDWVLEAVAERLDIKESVFQDLLPHLKDTAILTSNTSGIPLARRAENLPEGVK